LIAVATLAAAHDPPLLPVPAEVPGRFGALAWKELAGDPEASAFDLEARAKREFAVVAAWRPRNPPDPGRSLPALDFEAVVAWLREAVVNPDNESILTARVVSAHLRRALDPHTAIAPYASIAKSLHRAPLGTPHFQPQGPSVTRRRRFAHGLRLGWIRIELIDDAACVAVSSALLDPSWADVQGLVLDLRGNAGGVADQAACIAGLFLDAGTPILRLEPMVPDFAPRALTARSAALSSLPLVVLIDAGTASGAEVIAGALQAQRRAFVVGARSFGKGTYQQASPWSEHAEVVYYRTVARLVVPPGFEFQVHGVRPDFEGPAPRRSPLREADAYVNPIPARYPPLPQYAPRALRDCLARTSQLSPLPTDQLAESLLWCRISGSSGAEEDVL